MGSWVSAGLCWVPPQWKRLYLMWLIQNITSSHGSCLLQCHLFLVFSFFIMALWITACHCSGSSTSTKQFNQREFKKRKQSRTICFFVFSVTVNAAHATNLWLLQTSLTSLWLFLVGSLTFTAFTLNSSWFFNHMVVRSDPPIIRFSSIQCC